MRKDMLTIIKKEFARFFGDKNLFFTTVIMHRYVLYRDIEILDTECGNIRKKIASGYGVKRTKLEYEDVANAAIRKGCSITDIEDKLMAKTFVHKNNL